MKAEDRSENLQLLNVHQVAERLSVSTITVRRLISRGELKSCRIGDRVLVSVAHLRAYISSVVVR